VRPSHKAVHLQILRGLHLIPSLVARRGHLCDLDIDSLGPLKLRGYGTQTERDPVSPLRHEVALDIRDVDEVLLSPLALEEAVAPGPAEVSHLPCLDIALGPL